MSQPFSMSALKRMAEEALYGKEYIISSVVERFRQASNANPHDHAIGTAKRVIEKMAIKKGSFATINQAEIQDIFNQVNGFGNISVFREHLGDLLLADQAPKKVTTHNEGKMASMRSSGSEIDIVNPDIAESLAGLFDNSVKTTKGSFVDNGRKGIEIELQSIGLNDPRVEVAAKNDQFVIYAAQVPTPKGFVAINIPAEIRLGTVLMPSVFASTSGLKEINKENIIKYVEAVLERGEAIRPFKLLDELTKKVKLAEVDFDVSQISLDAPMLYNNKEEVENTEISVKADVQTPKELLHITENMVDEVLTEAGLSIEPKLVAATKALIARELQGMGIPYKKVTVASEFEGGITIAAHIVGTSGHKTIEVPVEIINGKPLMPSVFTSGVVAKSFDRENLKAFAFNKDEGTFSASISDKNCMSFKQLHNIILKNAAYGNFVEVEEAMAVIADRFGDAFHKAAFDDLMGLLNVGFGTEEKPLNTMDKYIKDAIDKARDKEANIKMSSNLMYLLPTD